MDTIKTLSSLPTYSVRPMLSHAEPVQAPHDLMTLGSWNTETEKQYNAASLTEIQKTAASVPVPPKDRRWEDEIIYFAMTDRFSKGSGNGSGEVHKDNPEGFHGGAWQGIINRLDDLADMGVTTVWLSPVIENDRNFFNKDGYHGYWPHDFYKPEQSFGTMEKLQELVSKAHEKGMKIIIDLVLNHTGYNHPWAHDESHREWFHHDGGMDREKRALFGLPDFAQEKPEVADYLIEMSKWWIQKTGADGYRLDALMHMPGTFIRQFSDEMHKTFGSDFFLLGEAYNPDPSFVASYENNAGMDSMFDYALSDAIRNVVTEENDKWLPSRLNEYFRLRREFPGESHRVLFPGKKGTKQFHNLFAQDAVYAAPQKQTTLIENHDMPRFLSMAGSDERQKLKLALGLEFTFRGIPTVYYGTEDGMKGMTSAEVRADKHDGADPEMRSYMRTLAHMRRDNIALRRGEQKEILSDRQVYAFKRVHRDQTILTAANVSSDAQIRSLSIPEGKARVRNILTGETFSCKDGRMTVNLPPHDFAVFEICQK